MLTSGRSLWRSHTVRFALVGLSLTVSLSALAKTPQEIFQANAPSIVVVEVYDSAGKLESTGSGVTIATGEVITNCHVAQEGKTLVVRQGKIKYPAQLHYSDRDRDLCQLAVQNFKAPHVTLGNMTSLKVGMRVVAIGAPEGLELSVSEGLIASLREFDSTAKLIQTTAPISPGSSGGGLFDEEGHLIGITTFYLAEGQNLNFALPANWIPQLPNRKLSRPKAKITSMDWVGGAMALEQKKDWSSLATYSRRWIQTEPQNGIAWIGLGESLSGLGHKKQGIVAFREALQIDPNNAYAWYNIGVAYADLKQFDQAIVASREALRINPKIFFAWYNIGVVYADLKQFDQAIVANREELQIDPNNVAAWNNIGVAYVDLKQFDQAIVAYREALQIDPKNAKAWYNIGIAYFDLKQFDQAIVADREALQIDPNNVAASINIGVAYFDLKQFDQAIVTYREVLRIDPYNALAWFLLGINYSMQGNQDGVIEAYQSLLTLDPVEAKKLFNLAIAPR